MSRAISISRNRLRLPRQHLVRQPLEGLAQHDEPAALGVACAEVQVAEHALAAAASPLDRQDDEVERPRLFDLEPGRAAAPRRVPGVERLRHDALVTGGERTGGELGRLACARRHDPRNAIRRDHLLVQRVDAPGQRLVDECVAVDVERVEEDRGDRQRLLQPIESSLRPNRRIVI